MAGSSRNHILLIAAGALFALLGIVLVIGGVQLAALGGSWYYLLAGLALVASGILIGTRKALGVWLYVGLFALTLIWSAFEAGGNFWAWVPRFICPLILLMISLALLPLLRPTDFGWKKAGISMAAVLVASLVGGALLYNSSSAIHASPMPQASGQVADRTDWESYGGVESQRYSTLTQINADDVDKLERVWLSHTGDLPEDMKDNSYGAETTPLKVGNRLYLCSATNIMMALDPETGKQIWRYDPGVDKKWIPYTAACRGVTYYETPNATAAECHTRIIEGTLDGRLVAVDAETGRPCQDFGQNGSASIKTGMGDIVPGMVSMTAAPTIVDGVIVTGQQVLDGQKLDAPSGVIKGFDAVTGELLWSWDMTRPDITKLPPEGETFTRGTPNMWTTAAGDDALGLVYLPLGSAAVDYWSGDRTDLENEFATSLVAIDVHTGKPAWHFQAVHKDVWDYDLGSQPSLVDYKKNGQTIPAILLPGKQGDLYILDRKTGAVLSGVEERPAPTGGVEPDERSPTQPHSTFATLAKEPLTEKDMWGMSPIDQMICRIGFRKASYKGMYTPPTTDTHWIEYPGYNGGSDWGSVAVDPVHGIIFANYNDMPNYNRLVPRAEADKLGWKPRGETPNGKVTHGAEGAGDPQAGAPYAIDVNAGWRMPFTGLLCKQPPYGGMRAIDMATGKTLWDRDLGTARNNGPFGIPSMLPLTIGTPNNGGPLATAGNLVFVAATTDGLIRAIDTRTGKTVWHDTLPAGGQATPMTYMSGGRQYLVLMTGGHHFMKTPVGDQVIAWALPESSLQ